MSTTDLHVHVLPYDYYADRPVDTVGLARTAALIATARGEAANSILVDNGDFLQGNPMGDYIAYERGLRPGDLHPAIAAMNTLGFDAATLGNHEFNYGLDFLMTALDGAAFPATSANVVRRRGADPRRDTPLIRPYLLLDRLIADGAGRRHKIRIGLIGFAPPQTADWDRAHLAGRAETRDIVETAQAWLPEMREAGADLIIALSHSGIGGAGRADGMENAAVPLARLHGIDAIVTGHGHQVFPSPVFAGLAGVDSGAGTIAGKPAVMAGFWGSHLGLIDLCLEREGGLWRVLGARSEARPILRHRPGAVARPMADCDPAVRAAVERDHRATLAYIRRPVGRTAVALHSYFALVANDAALRLVAEAQADFVRDRLAGGTFADLPLLSAAAPFKAGGRGGPGYYADVAAGDIALRNVADLYFYPNAIRAVKVTGRELAEWLERAASVYNRITPGLPDQMLLDPETVAYGFDVIFGVTYRIDLSAPARYGPKGVLVAPQARRIVGVAWQGRAVAADDSFIVATNSYRASGAGGGGFPGNDSVVFSAPDTNRDILARHIARVGTITRAATDTWRFAPLPATSAVFDTGPGAIARLQDLVATGRTDIDHLGPGPEGFARFRLRFPTV